MRVKVQKAASVFFPNTSLEFVYFEALANSLDANASEVKIAIELDKFSEQENLLITIEDNGDGFIDRNFEKFCSILDTEDKQHKGIGRLVFLNYFTEVKIESIFHNKKRTFAFNESFDGASIISDTSEKNKTLLTFTGYQKDKIGKYDYVVPESVKESIIYHFLPRFYAMKMTDKKFRLSISLSTNDENNDKGFYSHSTEFDLKDLPLLKEKTIDDPSSLFSYFKLMYSIENVHTEQSVISAICADNRTIPMELITNKDFPFGYKMVFILYSDNFDGKTDNSREVLDLDNRTVNYVRKVFLKLVAEVIHEEIPSIVEQNRIVENKLENDYPHLEGYINKETIGLVDKNSLIEDAQMKFFHEQKELLEASTLSDEQYEKSLEFSSRVLMEYILYRTKIISKLKEMDATNDEAEIHDLIVPRKKEYNQNELIDDIYQNNAWVLDDKYMTYSKVLSDQEVEKIYTALSVNGSYNFSDKENGRPDVTIIFSNDPNSFTAVDVVIIEFKKLGLKLADKEEVVSQLKQRARRLLEIYPNKIQRIWFYGIIDFDSEFKASLKESGFTKLFSNGDLYYKNQEIVINPDTEEIRLADLFLLSYDAMLDDAESRNATFLRILKQGIKKSASES